MPILLYSLDHPFQKIDSDGFLVLLGEGAPTVALDHAGFAHSSIADDHHLPVHGRQWSVIDACTRAAVFGYRRQYTGGSGRL